jgi:hypothetical protein
LPHAIHKSSDSVRDHIAHRFQRDIDLPNRRENIWSNANARTALVAHRGGDDLVFREQMLAQLPGIDTANLNEWVPISSYLRMF